jgi:hypothetical protein
VTRDQFEARLLSLWMTTRLPLTRANVQFVTGVPRAKLQKWLDQLTSDGVIEVDSDDEGELIWSVCGAARTNNGPSKPEEVKKLADLKREVGGAGGSAAALIKVGASAASSLVASGGDNRKSLIASGLLSFFFGPLGWLYAAPLREAGPIALLYVLLSVIVPHFLWLPIIAIAHPLSAAVGVAYAWRHNQKGERTSLMPGDPKRALPPRR